MILLSAEVLMIGWLDTFYRDIDTTVFFVAK